MTFSAVLHLFATWFTATSIIAVICIVLYVLTFFVPKVPLVSDEVLPHLRAILLTIGVSAAVASYIYAAAYKEGYQYAVNQVAAKNAEATHAVENAKTKVDQCFNSGGDWDTVSGVCQHQ